MFSTFAESDRLRSSPPETLPAPPVANDSRDIDTPRFGSDSDPSYPLHPLHPLQKRLPAELQALTRTGVTAWQLPRKAWLGILRHLPVQDHPALLAAARDEHLELTSLRARASLLPTILKATSVYPSALPAADYVDVQPAYADDRPFDHVADRTAQLPISAPPVYAAALPELKLCYLNAWIDQATAPALSAVHSRTRQTSAERQFCDFAIESMRAMSDTLTSRAMARSSSIVEREQAVTLHLEIFRTILRIRDRFNYEPYGEPSIPTMLCTVLDHLQPLSLPKKTAALGAFADLIRIYDSEASYTLFQRVRFNALRNQFLHICGALHSAHGFAGLPVDDIAMSRLISHRNGDRHDEPTDRAWKIAPGGSRALDTPLWDVYRRISKPEWRSQAAAEGIACTRPVWQHLREHALLQAVHSLRHDTPDHAFTITEAAKRWDLNDSCDALSFLTCRHYIEGRLSLSASAAEELLADNPLGRIIVALHTLPVFLNARTSGRLVHSTALTRSKLSEPLKRLLIDLTQTEMPDHLLRDLDITRYAPETWPTAVACFLAQLENLHRMQWQSDASVKLIGHAFSSIASIELATRATLALHILHSVSRMAQVHEATPRGKIVSALLHIVNSVATAMREDLLDENSEDSVRDEIRLHYRALVIAMHRKNIGAFMTDRARHPHVEPFAADYLLPLPPHDLLNLFCCGDYVDSLTAADSAIFHGGLAAAIADRPGLWNGLENLGNGALALYLDWARQCSPADWDEHQRLSFSILLLRLERSSFVATNEILRVLRRRIFDEAYRALPPRHADTSNADFSELKQRWGLPDSVTSMRLDKLSSDYFRDDKKNAPFTLPKLLALGVTDAWVIARAERTIASDVLHAIPFVIQRRGSALLALARERNLSDRAILSGTMMFPDAGFSPTRVHAALQARQH